MYFTKVSKEEWVRCCSKLHPSIPEENWLTIYDTIKLPTKGSKRSAGHDFYLPFDCIITAEDEKVIIPTGIRWMTDETDGSRVLLLCPRSGLGTKYGFRLLNTIGVVDADYCCADNEGHIMAVVEVKKALFLKAGDRFMQGVIVPFFSCVESDEERSGGFGSTGE